MAMSKLCSFGCNLFVAGLLQAQIVSAEVLPSQQPQPVISVSQKAAEAAMKQKALQWVDEVAGDISAIRYINQLAKLYHNIGYSPLWQDTLASAEFENQLKVLALANVSADFSSRYALLRHFRRSGDWRQYDLLATDSLLAYMSYAESVPEFGRGWLFGAGVDLDLPLPSVMGMSQLLSAIETNRLHLFVANLKPFDERYTQIFQAINVLQQVEASRYWPRFYQEGLIRAGAELDEPESLIAILENLGDLTAEQAEQLRAEEVQTLNFELVEAVKRFQQRHGLKVDGVIGPKTRYWLSMTPLERIRVLALNAQRLRLWPVEHPSVLIVNIPDFGMSLWLDNEHVMESKVIVGRPSRRTPLMSSTISSVVFNPYWNVPISIMRKDILPKAQYDRGYLYRNDFRVIRSWTSNEQIPIHTIDWRIVNSKSFPYRLRQKPGKKNALGRFKFNIPNDNSIYLHDTPAKKLFNEETRAFSSGCVRVEHADELAMILLNYSGVPEERVNQLKARRNTKTVGLNSHIYIHVIYQTAWVDGDGQVNFRNDVYRYDQFGHMSQNGEKLTKNLNE